jgi:hypothetical protein
MLDKSLFGLTRLTREILLICHATLWLYFQELPGFNSFHLHEGPHILTDNLFDKWKDDAKGMLPFLHIRCAKRPRPSSDLAIG